MVIGFTTCDLIDGHEFTIGDNVQFLNNSYLKPKCVYLGRLKGSRTHITFHFDLRKIGKLQLVPTVNDWTGSPKYSRSAIETYALEKYGGYHKIKHFACHRDFFVHKIPRIKHTQNASYPGIKHFQWLILFLTNDWHWNEWFMNESLVKCFIPGYEAFSVCFILGILCKQNSLWQAKWFILWYPTYVIGLKMARKGWAIFTRHSHFGTFWRYSSGKIIIYDS